MMQRDERLTGSRRGQSVRSFHHYSTVAPIANHLALQTNPIAPKEFATNSMWSTEKLS